MSLSLKEIVFGKTCTKCADQGFGIVCDAAESFLVGQAKLGETEVAISGLVGTFIIPEKIDKCQIRTGKISMKTGTEEIKRAAQQAKEGLIKEAMEEAILEIEEGEIKFTSDIWSQSK